MHISPFLFICEHVVLCTCVLSLFCLFVGQQRLYMLVFLILYTCGPAAFVHVGLSHFKYLWACGAVRMGLPLFIYLWARCVVCVDFSPSKYL